MRQPSSHKRRYSWRTEGTRRPTSATAPAMARAEEVSNPKSPQAQHDQCEGQRCGEPNTRLLRNRASCAGSMERSRTSGEVIPATKSVCTPMDSTTAIYRVQRSKAGTAEASRLPVPGQRDRPPRSGDVPPPTTAGDGVEAAKRGVATPNRTGMVRSQSDSAPPPGAHAHAHATATILHPSHWVFPPFEKTRRRAEFPRVFTQLMTLQCVRAPCPSGHNSRQSAPRENAPLLHCMAVQHRCCCRAKSAQCNPDVRKCHQFDHDAKVVVLMHCGAEKVTPEPLGDLFGCWWLSLMWAIRV